MLVRFQRCCAVKKMIPVRERILLARCVSRTLAASFGEEFDQEFNDLPHRAEDAAALFGIAGADAAAATEAELAEAKTVLAI